MKNNSLRFWKLCERVEPFESETIKMNRAEKRRQQKLAEKTAGDGDQPSFSIDIADILNQAVGHHQAGRLQVAEGLYRQVLQAEPNQPNALNLLGMLAHQVGQTDVAVELLTKAVAVLPGFMEAHNNLGNAHKDLGELGRAIASYREAININPSFAEAHYNLGVVHKDLGDLEGAVTSYEKAIAIRPDYVKAHYNLGLVLYDIGQRDAAAVSYKEALAINPNYAEAHSNLGNVLIDIGRLEEAVAHCRKAVELKPDFVEAQINLGTALQKTGHNDEAIKTFKRIISINPDNAIVQYDLGVVLLEAGEFEDAANAFQKVISISPDYAEAHFNMGNVLRELGKLDEAVACYHNAISNKPEFARAHNNLGMALKDLGEMEKAVQVLQSALEIVPGNQLISYNLFNILNYHTQSEDNGSAYIRAQNALQSVSPGNTESPVITDKSVIQLYQKCQKILEEHELNGEEYSLQMWRGYNSDLGCRRHMKVFDTFKIIPEFCFGCFKISIKPRSVIELFKLMLVFDSLDLKNDNTRKCFVEIRPEIAGAYTGLIYCLDYDEGVEIAETVQAIVAEKISEKIPVSLKRGCSEYPLVFPEFPNIGSNQTTTMMYNEEWRKQEAYTDKNLMGHKYPPQFDSHNHTGFTLQDAIVMRSWLVYAADIGDPSYLKISGTPMGGLPINPRPKFQPVADE